MSDAESVVRAFFDATAKPGNLQAALDTHFAPDGVWENTGLPTANGLEEAKGFMQSFTDGHGLDALTVEFRGLAVSGDMVLTERIDHLDKADGERIASLPVSGTLEVKDGKIVAWRDYFDPRPFLGEG